jgi:hypothetical protein
MLSGPITASLAPRSVFSKMPALEAIVELVEGTLRQFTSLGTLVRQNTLE